MVKIEETRVKKRALFSFSPIILFCIIAIVAVTLFWDTRLKLEPGLTNQQIALSWGAPEYTIKVEGNREFWSYEPPNAIPIMDDILFSKIEPPPAGQIVSIEDLDKFSGYGHEAMLFDENKTLEAYFLPGEESRVHSKYGDFDVGDVSWEAYADIMELQTNNPGEHRGR